MRKAFITLDGTVYEVPRVTIEHLKMLQERKNRTNINTVERDINDYNHLIESVKVNFRPVEIEEEFNTVVIQKGSTLQVDSENFLT